MHFANPGEGNCLWHSLSQGTGFSYTFLRMFVGYRCLFSTLATPEDFRHLLNDGEWGTGRDISLCATLATELFHDGILMYHEEMRVWFCYSMHFHDPVECPDPFVRRFLHFGWNPVCLWYTPMHFRCLRYISSTQAF